MLGVASLVLGIISIILSFVPFCNYFVAIPAIVGLVLGIIDTINKSKRNEPKGMSIAGIILNSVAIVLILFWTLILAIGIAEDIPY